MLEYLNGKKSDRSREAAENPFAQDEKAVRDQAIDAGGQGGQKEALA